jgi:hypothetical protein
MKKIIFFFFLSLAFFLTWIYSLEADITDTSFTIDVGTITPGGNALIRDGAGATVENVLAITLNKLIVVFWVLAVFIMTIGAWYMIIYHWQDELLSKWKSIFFSGIIALVVALSAWIIVNLFTYLLY